MRSALAAEWSGDPSAHRGHSVRPGPSGPGSLRSHPVPQSLTQSSCQKGPGKAEQVQGRQGPWGRGVSAVGTDRPASGTEARSSTRGAWDPVL